MDSSRTNENGSSERCKKCSHSTINSVVEFEEKYRKPPDKTTNCSRLQSYIREKFTRQQVLRYLNDSFPFVSNLRTYKFRQDFLSDVIAGLTVGIMQIPQGMAYAMLSSLPPVCGLYISFFSPLAYFFLGSSRHASMGCISVVSLMVGSVIDTQFPSEPEFLDSQTTNNTIYYQGNTNRTVDILDIAADPHIKEKIELAASVSFISGFIMIMAGRIGFGFITTYMPESMVSGFTSAVGIIVASNQAKHIFGLILKPQIGSFKLVKTWIDIFANLKNTNYIPVIMTVICMVVMYIVKIHINQRFKHRLKIPIPIEIIVVALATTVSHFGNFPNLKILKEIPAGVPEPSIPSPSVGILYLKEAFIIGVVAFTQSVSMAKILARKNNYSIDPNQEMVAYGASSVVCSVFSGYIPAASVSRSMIQDGAGGKTQVASLFGCLVVLVIILAVGPLFYSLPKCVLSAIIIINLRAMFLQFLEVKPLWRKSKSDFFIWLVTFGATLIIDADIGIAVGILFSLLMISVRIQRTKGHVVSYVNESGILRDTAKYKKCEQTGNHTIIQYHAPICFTNADKFVEDVYMLSDVNPAKVKKARNKARKQEKLQNQETAINGLNSEEKEGLGAKLCSIDTESSLQYLILDMRGVGFIDLTGVKALRRIFADYEEIDVKVHIVECNDAVISTLRMTDLLEEKPDSFFMNVESAVSSTFP